MKKCIKCNLEKNIEDFSKCKNLKSGYRNECKKCMNEYKKNNIKYNWTEEHYNENDNKIFKCGKCKEDKLGSCFFRDNRTKNGYCSRCKKCQNEYNKYIYYKNNWHKNNRILINKYRRDKYKNDDIYRLSECLRSLVNRGLKKYNKKSRTEEILGCSFIQFKEYIESKFENWMNWDNYGKYNGELNYGWDIDHIIPISSAKTEDEIINLNHYTNLQPLCSKINRDIKKDN